MRLFSNRAEGNSGVSAPHLPSRFTVANRKIRHKLAVLNPYSSMIPTFVGATESQTLMIRWHLQLTPCSQCDREIRRFGQPEQEEGFECHWQNIELRARISANTMTKYVGDMFHLTGPRQADTLMWDAV